MCCPNRPEIQAPEEILFGACSASFEYYQRSNVLCISYFITFPTKPHSTYQNQICVAQRDLKVYLVRVQANLDMG